MWKLPMFGCTDADQVLKEVNNCTKAFPNAYVRLIAFDNVRQVQVMSFLVQRPKSATDWQVVEGRSVWHQPWAVHTVPVLATPTAKSVTADDRLSGRIVKVTRAQ
jgi:hypothetical protein